MSGKDDNKKGSRVGGIEGSKKTSEVKKTSSIDQIDAVKAASGVGSVKGTGGVDGARRKATRVMSAEEREKLLSMVDDEAEKLFKSGAMPGANKELITKAVKMAVDSSIVLDKDVNDKGQDKS